MGIYEVGGKYYYVFLREKIGISPLADFNGLFFFYYQKNPFQMKSKLKKPVAVVGYSGHSYVIIDILLNAGRMVTAYCDSEEKDKNPYNLSYLGKENEVLERLKIFDAITGLNSNDLNRKALHKKYGEMSLLKWTEFFLLHEAHHLFTIFMLSSQLRKLKQ